MAGGILKKYVLGFTVKDDSVKEAVRSIDRSIGDLYNRVKGYILPSAIAASVAKVTHEYYDQAIAMANVSRMTGQSVESISRLGLAFEKLGGDASDAGALYKNLQQGLLDARYGQGMLVDVTKKYGLALSNTDGTMKSSDQMLHSIANRMSTLSQAQKVDMAGMLGLDREGMQLLSNGSKGLNAHLRAVNSSAVISSKDAKAAEEWRKVYTEFRQELRKLANDIGREVLPYMKQFFDITKKVITYIIENKGFVVGVFAALATALVSVKYGLLGFARMSFLAFAPYVLGIAAVAAVFAVLEDLYGYMNGKDSVVGRMAQQWKWFKVVLDTVVETIHLMHAGLETLISLLDKLSNGNLFNYLARAGFGVIDSVGSSIMSNANINTLSLDDKVKSENILDQHVEQKKRKESEGKEIAISDIDTYTDKTIANMIMATKYQSISGYGFTQKKNHIQLREIFKDQLEYLKQSNPKRYAEILKMKETVVEGADIHNPLSPAGSTFGLDFMPTPAYQQATNPDALTYQNEAASARIDEYERNKLRKKGMSEDEIDKTMASRTWDYTPPNIPKQNAEKAAAKQKQAEMAEPILRNSVQLPSVSNSTTSSVNSPTNNINVNVTVEAGDLTNSAQIQKIGVDIGSITANKLAQLLATTSASR